MTITVQEFSGCFMVGQGKLLCKRCHYEWQSREQMPKECPRCKSRKWNEERKRKDKSV